MLSSTSSRGSSVVPLNDGVWSLVTVPPEGLAMVMLGGSAAATEIGPAATAASEAMAAHRRPFLSPLVGPSSRPGRDRLSIPIRPASSPAFRYRVRFLRRE